MGPRKVADEASFSDIDLEEERERDSELPPSLMGGDDESSFSGLGDEPSTRRSRARRVRRARRPRTSKSSSPTPREVDELGEGDLEGGDDFGEEEFAGGDEEDEDLEGAEPGTDEEMEFGISGDEAAQGLSLPPEVLRKQRGEEFEAKQAALGRRTLTIVLRIAAVLVLVIGGGAALNFTEYGLFGIYYWERWLPEAGDPEFARSAIEKAEKLSSKRHVRRRQARAQGAGRGAAQGRPEPRAAHAQLAARVAVHRALRRRPASRGTRGGDHEAPRGALVQGAGHGPGARRRCGAAQAMGGDGRAARAGARAGRERSVRRVAVG